MTTANYNEASIVYHKEDTAKIRARPNMYIGPTDSSGIFTLVREACDNAVDEFLAGRNNYVHIYHEIENGSPIFTVVDRGVGIPVGIHAKAKISALTIVLTSLQGGAKMDDRGGAYASSIGTHGVGIKATNALSSQFKVWTHRKDSGGWWSTEFAAGLEKAKPAKTKAPKLPNGTIADSGTIIRFTPDKTIFKAHKFNVKDLEMWMQLTSYMNPGLTVAYTNPKGKTVKLLSKRGVLDYLDKKVGELKCEMLGKPCHSSNAQMDLVLAWTNAEGCSVEFFTNTVRNVDGGVHATALFDALAKSLKPYQGNLEFTPTDLREGLVGVLNFKIASPKFSSQTKEKLVDERARPLCLEEAGRVLAEFWSKHKSMAKEVCKRAAELRKATADFLKNKLLVKNIKAASKSLPAKLGMAVGCKPEDRELYIVEGDSAAGPCLRARFKKYQEVWPLKGKITNAMRESLSKVAGNADIAGIFAAIGLNPDAKIKSVKSLRVGKVIFLADPDSDGPLHKHTRVLTLDGKNPTIGELAKKWKSNPTPFWVYSRNQEGVLVPALAENPRKVVTTTSMARLTLDSGDPIQCTPDHKWKLKNPKKSDKRVIWAGNHGYIATQDLRKGDSIDSAYFDKLPLHSGKDRLYTAILNEDAPGQGNRQTAHTFVHRWVKASLQPKKYAKYVKANDGIIGGAVHIHHENDDTLDNRPENLQFLTRKKHYGKHGKEMAATYNGSKKHLADLDNFYSSERGVKFKEQAARGITAYNISDEHRNTVAEQNRDPEQIERQLHAKCARLAQLLHKKGILNSKNWDTYTYTRKARRQCVTPKYSKLTIDFEYLLSLEVSLIGLKLVRRGGYENDNQKYGNFVSLCDQTIDRHGKLNRDTYSETKSHVLLTKGCRFYPKWDTMKQHIGKSDEGMALWYRSRKGNHRVVSVHIEECKSTPMYCLTVPEYGNFMVDDGNGNGVCSSNCHINALLLGLFWKYMPEMFNESMIYVAAVHEFVTNHKGKMYGAMSPDKLYEKIGTTKASVMHVKGYGELSDSVLRWMAFDPSMRRLWKVLPPIGSKGKLRFHSVMEEDSAFRKTMLNVL